MANNPINRDTWLDIDWAVYLGCSVKKVREYREILSKIFLTDISFHKTTGKYAFCLYKYHKHPSGFESLQLVNSSNIEFDSVEEARNHANTNIIPKLMLNKFRAKQIGVNAKAIQMMLIREK